jgi:hypothetical protein
MIQERKWEKREGCFDGVFLWLRKHALEKERE